MVSLAEQHEREMAEAQQSEERDELGEALEQLKHADAFIRAWERLQDKRLRAGYGDLNEYGSLANLMDALLKAERTK